MKKRIYVMLILFSFAVAPFAYAGGEYEDIFSSTGCGDSGWDGCVEQTPPGPPSQ